MRVMEFLGYLAWWGVSDVRLTTTDAERMVAELRLDVAPPRPPAPIDVFRRLVTVEHTYPGFWRDGTEECMVHLGLHTVESPSDSMMVKHIVMTKKVGNVTKYIDRVGEVAFYKPPRGQASRARIRTQVENGPTADPEVTSYAKMLHDRYDLWLDSIDDQGARRLVRAFLKSVDARYLNGVYVLPGVGHAAQLEAMIGRLGGSSYCHTAPLVDNEIAREMLAMEEET